jgi:hypothetical protein
MRLDVYVPDPVFDAIEEYLGRVPTVVNRDDHDEGRWLEHAVGTTVYMNQRFTDKDCLGLYLKGYYVMPESAHKSNRAE